MLDCPQVSVIIPTYKRPKKCLRAVKSVLLQTFQDFEIIVGDDFGKDETKALLAELGDPRIRYFDNQGKGGSASSNRNLCLERSLGRYVTFLDSDDFILPDKLQLQYAALSVNDYETGFVISGTRVIKVQGGKYYRYKDLIPTAEGDIRKAYFERRLNCYNTSLMVRRDALDSVGRWDPRIGPYDDSELLMRLLLKYKAAKVSQVGTLWFDHDGVDSFSNDQVARLSGLHAFLSKHASLMVKYPLWANNRMLELAKLQFMAGKAKCSRASLRKVRPTVRGRYKLMKLVGYIPCYASLLASIYPTYSKLNKPEWLKAESQALQALIPKRHVDVMIPIL
ncbi:MAG: glycosyltransferase family 2 protein [Coraliomargaritaceae bacterium]